MIKSLQSVNFVLSVGSVDGVCTSAAVLRNAGPTANITFCQAFTVDKVDPATWGDRRNVLFVDLAVNNRDPSMTVDFLWRVKSAGHKIIGVLDEHNAEDWQKAFAAAKLSFDELSIKPVSQDKGDIKSSGALLLSLLGDEEDEQTCELCNAGDAGDRMDFSTHFGGVVNQAVKSRIVDDSRRVYLAKHFAQNHDADATIQGWIEEYEAIIRNHDIIVDQKVDRGDGIHRVNACEMQVDMTSLMFRLYSEGARVVALYGEAFVPAEKCKRTVLSLGTNDKGLDLMAIVREAGVNPLGGFAQKVNIEMSDEEAALSAVRAALTA
jgi:hypothetical protein